jgi:MFS family permease
MIRGRNIVSALGVALHNGDIRRVQVAWGGAIAAEWAHFVALGVYAYEHGGTQAVGVAGLVRLLPAALIAPFAASLGDHFRRERFLLGMTLVGSGALAASAAASFVGERTLVFVFAAVIGVSSTLFRPALQALLPSLARTPEELIASNGTTSMVESVGTLVGPVAAGVLVSVASVGVAFAAAGGMLLVSAALLRLVRTTGHVELTAAAGETVGTAIAAGLALVARAPRPRLLVGLGVAQAFVRGCLNVLIVVAAFRVLGGGGLIGAVGAMTLGERRLGATFGLALVFWGLPIMLIAPQPDFAAAIVLLAVVGAANSVEDVAIITLLQRTVPNEFLTRVLGVLWGLAMGGVALGSIAAPAIVDSVGARPAFVVVGSILPVLALATYRRLAEIDRTHAPERTLDLIDGVPMFEPLSIAMKERLAATLVPVSVAAGDVVIRAGDSGDRFYVVDDGELDVDSASRHAVAYSGDYFGEVALLRDIPRTATVKAAVDSRLYALRRDAFLAAVTGHPAAHAAGREVAEARLAQVGH